MNRKRKAKISNKFKRPAVFLDRDGTINYDRGYTYKFSEFKFRPFVIKGLKYLTEKKYFIFVITNQAGIAKGKYKISDLLLLNKKLKKFLKNKSITINEIQYCPYHPNATIKRYKKKTDLRKPGNLMIRKILKKWNIDLKKSFMIGDKKTDSQAAKKSNLYFEFVRNNFYKQVKRITNSYL
tara:strand:+ start:12895 stop:13437 length:543 start_codon:yes stop_codon:yes gene_type:complete